MERKIWLIALVVYLLTAWFSEGYYHPDEHHQLLEFAAAKLDLREAESLSWEYTYKMRPTIQVYIVTTLYQTFDAIGLANPFWVATWLRFLSAALSLWGMWWMFQSFRVRWNWKGAQTLFLLLTLLLWFNVFNHVRFSSENWSGGFFMLAFAWLFSDRTKRAHHFLLIGLFLGFSFLFRYQSILLVGGLAAWLIFIQKMPWRSWVSIAIGGIIAIAIGWLADFAYYGEPSFTFYNYLEQNVILGKAESFGTDPWWYYLSQVFENAVPPFSLIYIVSALVVFIFRPKSVFTWTFLPFIILHSFTAHKELRFLFPIMGFVSLFIMETLDIWQQRKPGLIKTGAYRWTQRLFWGVNFAIVAVVAFKPVEADVALYQSIYNQYTGDVVVYAHKDHPYLGKEQIRFYARTNLQAKEVSSLEEIVPEPGQTILVVTRDPDLKAEWNEKYPCIYSGMPEWITAFNFNGWVERAKFAQVFQWTPTSSRPGQIPEESNN